MIDAIHLLFDSLSLMDYSSEDGKLVRINKKRGVYNIIPVESVLSQTTTIFGEWIKVTGRSCEVADSVETEVESTGSFLTDVFRFSFNGTIKLTETFMTTNGVTTKVWEFTEEVWSS